MTEKSAFKVVSFPLLSTAIPGSLPGSSISLRVVPSFPPSPPSSCGDQSPPPGSPRQQNQSPPPAALPQASKPLQFSIDNILKPDFGQTLSKNSGQSEDNKEKISFLKNIVKPALPTQRRPSFSPVDVLHTPPKTPEPLRDSPVDLSQHKSPFLTIGRHLHMPPVLPISPRTFQLTQPILPLLKKPDQSSTLSNLSLISAESSKRLHERLPKDSSGRTTVSPNSQSIKNNSITTSSSCLSSTKLSSTATTTATVGTNTTDSGSSTPRARYPDNPEELANPVVPKEDMVWPAWVYCTRYSDRPSSGPRSRRIKRKSDSTSIKSPEEKRPRTAFTTDQLNRLKKEFEDNKYLSEKRRQDLARDLCLNESQIKIWFQNKRAKIKKVTGSKSGLAQHLAAQGLYNHTTSTIEDDFLD